MTTSSRDFNQFALPTFTLNKNEEDRSWGLFEDAMYLGFYAGIIALFLMIVALVVKLLWNWDGNEDGEEDTRANESSRLLLSEEKAMFSSYGTSEDDNLEFGKTSSGSSSSDDLYDEKICVICYDDQRSCLFVPCGHCVICYTCTCRIIKKEVKSCPICRTIIHKVRKLQIL